MKRVEDRNFQLPFEMIEISRDVKDLIPGLPVEGDLNGWITPFPQFQRNLIVGHEDVDYFWLVQPELVAKSRAMYLEMMKKANKEQNERIMSGIEAFAGSLRAFKDLQWCFALWRAGGVGQLRVWPSLRSYLEDVTNHSNKDLSSE